MEVVKDEERVSGDPADLLPVEPEGPGVGDHRAEGEESTCTRRQSWGGMFFERNQEGSGVRAGRRPERQLGETVSESGRRNGKHQALPRFQKGERIIEGMNNCRTGYA
jgi:hypothetical protein